MLCKQLKIQIGVNCVQSVSIMCLLRQVLSNNNEDRVRVRYLFTNFAIVIQIYNHRDKRPYDLSFGQHINDNS